MSEGSAESPQATVWTDEFGTYLCDALRTPEFRREFKRAGRRLDNGHGEAVAVKPALRGRRHGW